jgi:hypothetical protein
MNFLRNYFRNPNSACKCRGHRLYLEPLESRNLLSAPPGGLTDPFIRKIVDAEFTQDSGHLTRLDVIHLLEVVGDLETAVYTNGVVSFRPVPVKVPLARVGAAELTDLRTLVKDWKAWGMAADVANLFYKTVNANPANEAYLGQPLLSSGQLAAGDLDRVVADLVQKWFLGADLPDVTQAVKSAGITETVDYQTAQGVLFGTGGPSPNDIAQGVVGDCYFLSALGEVALKSPQTLENMFIDNGDGTYTVRFFEYKASNNTWHTDYVTVNRQLPVLEPSGDFLFANRDQNGKPTSYTDSSAILWPALAEKAYAQLAAEGWSRAQGPGGTGDGGTPSDWNMNCYDALSDGNSPKAIEQMGESKWWYGIGLSSATTKNETNLVQAFSQGNLVVVCSTTHVYMLTAVVQATNPANDQFTILNPYDTNPANRTLNLTWTDLKSELSNYCVISPPSS